MALIKRKKNLEILLHTGVWLLVYSLPFFVSWKNDDTELSLRMLHHAVIVLSLLTVFYVNYFYLIEEYLFSRNLGKYFLYNIIIIVVLGVGVHYWNEATLPMKIKNIPDPGFPRTIAFLIRDLMSLIMVTGLSVALKTTAKWYKSEADRKEEEKKRTEAELLALRQQINPHFLFNTLNNIYALIAISPETAQETVLELSKLMRYVLYENEDEMVSLNKEIMFIENYVNLMKIRLTGTVDIRFENSISRENSWQVAPMLYIALIENAFKHGISPTQASFIHIAFTIVDGRKLTCSVQNSFFPKAENDLAGSGIGLENMKRRLEIIYPDNHEFHSGELNGIYYSKLVLPLKPDLKI